MNQQRTQLPKITGFPVMQRMCKTCIYRPDSTLDLKKLEAQVADPKMPGHFRGYRVCHHAPPRSKICCRGFWEAHKDHFDTGQLAQRLDLVHFIDLDAYPVDLKKRRWKPGDARSVS